MIRPRSVSLEEMLSFCKDRTVERELSWLEANKIVGHRSIRALSYENRGGVLFTDGSRLVCALDYGFTGSDVTPPDSVGIEYLIVEASV